MAFIVMEDPHPVLCIYGFTDFHVIDTEDNLTIRYTSRDKSEARQAREEFTAFAATGECGFCTRREIYVAYNGCPVCGKAATRTHGR